MVAVIKHNAAPGLPAWIAVKVDASAALIEMTAYFDGRSARLPTRELELRQGMNILGHPVRGYGREVKDQLCQADVGQGADAR